MFFAIKGKVKPRLSSASHEIKSFPWDRRWSEGPWDLKSSPVKECPPHWYIQAQLGWLAPSYPPQPLLLKTSSRQGTRAWRRTESQTCISPWPEICAPEGRRWHGPVGITEDSAWTPALWAWWPQGSLSSGTPRTDWLILLDLPRSWPNWNSVFRNVNKFISPGTDCQTARSRTSAWFVTGSRPLIPVAASLPPKTDTGVFSAQVRGRAPSS